MPAAPASSTLRTQQAAVRKLSLAELLKSQFLTGSVRGNDTYLGRAWRIFGGEHIILPQIQHLTRFSPFLTDSCVRTMVARLRAAEDSHLARTVRPSGGRILSNACPDPMICARWAKSSTRRVHYNQGRRRKLARRFGNCVPFRHGIWGRAVRGRGIGWLLDQLAAYRPIFIVVDVHPGRGRGIRNVMRGGSRTECRGRQISGAQRERRRRGVTTPWQ